MKYQLSDYRYSLMYANGDIEESNNKTKLISIAKKTKIAAWVEDNKIEGIIYENKAQIEINNSNHHFK